MGFLQESSREVALLPSNNDVRPCVASPQPQRPAIVGFTRARAP